jgi:Cof subfamily protein (haloacid dehalogenase superfamily)
MAAVQERRASCFTTDLLENPMKYRLVALDLDGTLLDSSLNIRDATLETLREARSRGIQAMIVTGRHHTAAHAYWHQLQLDLPAICCNGTYVYDYRLNRPLCGNPLTQKEALDLLSIVREHPVHLMVYTEKAMTHEADAPHLAGMRRWSNTLPPPVRPRFERVDSFERVLEGTSTIWKFLIASNDLEALSACEQAVASRPEFECVRSSHGRSDISRAGNTKGQRLAEFIEQRGIAPQEVIAFGDQHNDKEMLELAGLGVAMGNGHPSLQELANYVAGSNDSDGIAEVLRQFVLTDL